jgi:hypothetical protein
VAYTIGVIAQHDRMIFVYNFLQPIQGEEVYKFPVSNVRFVGWLIECVFALLLVFYAI